MKTGGGLYPHHQDKDRPVLPIFIGYRTDLIPPPPLTEFSLIFGITAIIFGVALEYPSRKEKIIRHYMTKQALKRSLHFSALELFLYYFHKVASSVVTCAVSGWI